MTLGGATSLETVDTSLVLVPLGSTEQHGPHLPLDTDTRIATAVGRALAARFGDGWLLAPALHYGASGEHEGFDGTISIGTTVLQLLLIEYGRSACNWAGRLVFVNGHGGNLDALADLLDHLADALEGHIKHRVRGIEVIVSDELETVIERITHGPAVDQAPKVLSAFVERYAR